MPPARRLTVSSRSFAVSVCSGDRFLKRFSSGWPTSPGPLRGHRALTSPVPIMPSSGAMPKPVIIYNYAPTADFRSSGVSPLAVRGWDNRPYLGRVVSNTRSSAISAIAAEGSCNCPCACWVVPVIRSSGISPVASSSWGLQTRSDYSVVRHK